MKHKPLYEYLGEFLGAEDEETRDRSMERLRRGMQEQDENGDWLGEEGDAADWIRELASGQTELSVEEALLRLTEEEMGEGQNMLERREDRGEYATYLPVQPPAKPRRKGTEERRRQRVNRLFEELDYEGEGGRNVE